MKKVSVHRRQGRGAQCRNLELNKPETAIRFGVAEGLARRGESEPVRDEEGSHEGMPWRGVSEPQMAKRLSMRRRSGQWS